MNVPEPIHKFFKEMGRTIKAGRFVGSGGSAMVSMTPDTRMPHDPSAPVLWNVTYTEGTDPTKTVMVEMTKDGHVALAGEPRLKQRYLLAQQVGPNVQVADVPQKWVTYVKDFAMLKGLKMDVPYATSRTLAMGASGQPHVLTFPSAHQRDIQDFLDDFMESHHGQALRADLGV